MDVANAATSRCRLGIYDWTEKHAPRKTILCCSFHSLLRTGVPAEDRAAERSIEALEEPQKEGRTAEVQKMLREVRTLTGVSVAGDSPGSTYLGTFLCINIWVMCGFNEFIFSFTLWAPVCLQESERGHSAACRTGTTA